MTKRDRAGPLTVPPPGTRVGLLKTTGEEFLILSYPIAEFRAPDVLSSAEAAVALATIRGRSLPEIARERGTAVRTVANQLRAVYEKLGVRSRFELARILRVP